MSATSRSRFPVACLAAAALLAACENPLTEGDGGKVGKPSPVDTTKRADTAQPYDFTQGKLLPTGQAMHLAIEGKGFFVLKREGQYLYLRRPALFSRDSQGCLSLGPAQARLQGIRLADESHPYPALPAAGTRAELTGLEDVRWRADDIAPKRATSVIQIARNLPTEAWGKGSLLYSQPFLHHAEASDLLTSLRGTDGNPLGIRAGDRLAFTGAGAGAGSTVTVDFPVTAQTTLADLANAMTAFLRSASIGAGLGTTVDLVTSADSHTLRGALTVYGNTASIRDFKILSSRDGNAAAIEAAFALPAGIKAGTTRLSAVTPGLRSPATAPIRMVFLYDAQGNPLGLEAGDAISFSGAIGKVQAQNVSALVFDDRTTLEALLAKVRENFKLGNDRVVLNPAGSDDSLPDGSIVIRGYEGRERELRDVSIRSTDANSARPSPDFFNTNLGITTRQAAVDHKAGACVFKVYDAAGMERRLAVEFHPTPAQRIWKYTLALDSGLAIPGVTERTLEFDSNGTVIPRAANPIPVRTLDGLTFSNMELDLTGITQAGDSATVALIAQDGFPAGLLEQITIGEDGILSGAYANGKTRALFQLPLADFPNLAGLKPAGQDIFQESAESGKPAVTAGPHPAVGAIRSGSLEYVTEEERARVCAAHSGC